jgi:hypothetical protein
MPRASVVSPEQFTTFGELLRFLMRRANLNVLMGKPERVAKLIGHTVPPSALCSVPTDSI